jgi:membrane fusion protein (multidrug efflux system)
MKVNNRNGCACYERVVSQPTMGSAIVPSRIARRAIELLALLGFVASACGKNDASASQKTRPPPLVVVQKIERRDVPIEVRAPVDLRPLAQADVGSKMLGYVDAVLVDRGDRVKKGQLVALGNSAHV